MFKVGDRVKYVMVNEKYRGKVIEIIDEFVYRVELEDEDYNTFEEILDEDELEFISNTYLSRNDLIKIIHYEAKMSDYIDLEDSSIRFDFECTYQITLEDVLICLTNMKDQMDSVFDQFKQWWVYVLAGGLKKAYSIQKCFYAYYDCFKPNGIPAFNSEAMMGYIFLVIKDMSFVNENRKGKKEVLCRLIEELNQYMNSNYESWEERYYVEPIKRRFVNRYGLENDQVKMNEDELILYKRFMDELAKKD